MDYSKKNRDELVKICKDRKITGYSGKKKADIINLLQEGNVNVKNVSPLRYPGGKSRAISILEVYIKKYYPNKKLILSPFFGGGSFELHMKANGYSIKGNDLFDPLTTFWQMVQIDRDTIIKKIKEKMPVTKAIFQDLRKKILLLQDKTEKAVAYFILNRTSFSGATLCGGFSKQAAEGRLTSSSLTRLQECNLNDITFTSLDYSTFLEQNPETSDTIVYADPPYYIETYIYGKDGDLHEAFDHELFAKRIQSRSDWIISYNDCDYIRNLYTNCRIFKEKWSYGMNASKKSSEIIILPPTSCLMEESRPN